ncbi:MAG: 5-(carboxyamino)imidazole ribonucleotide synthase [Alphaproteobacteria bacterium]
MPAPEAGRVRPGAAIGILGGGQLGRMTALAAARLGYRSHVFAPEPGCPAAQVAAAATVADYADRAALDRFARAVEVVTFEFENVPADCVRYLAERVPVRPGAHALAVAQDRVAEKTFLRDIGAPLAPFVEVRGDDDLRRAIDRLGRPALLKTARHGYDGKGQVLITAGQDLAEAYARMGSERGVLEGLVDFVREISVIVARGADGATAAYVPVENRHERGILVETRAPASIGPEPSARAQALARRIAEGLEIVGLLAVEMFVARDGTILVNELAPRPHNSGHWTLDACTTSQFEQLVRAVCGLPLGSPERHSDAVMRNLIGAEAERWQDIVAEPGACLHLYGKTDARPGRKMGHVTRIVQGPGG